MSALIALEKNRDPERVPALLKTLRNRGNLGRGARARTESKIPPWTGAGSPSAGGHPARLAPAERGRPLRGLLVERLLRLVPGVGGRRGGGDATSRGRLDLAVVTGGAAFLFEFKVAERTARSSRPGGASEKRPPAENAALAQLRARRYADKYRAPGRAAHLIGVEISAAERDVAAFDVESDR